MSQPNFSSNIPSGQDDSPILTAMLGVAAVFILAAVVVLSWYLKSWYGAYLWNW